MGGEEREGRFENPADEALLVADPPALLAFHDGKEAVLYVRMDIYQAAGRAMNALWDLAEGDANALAREEVLAMVTEARRLAAESAADASLLADEIEAEAEDG